MGFFQRMEETLRIIVTLFPKNGGDSAPRYSPFLPKKGVGSAPHSSLLPKEWRALCASCLSTINPGMRGVPRVCNRCIPQGVPRVCNRCIPQGVYWAILPGYTSGWIPPYMPGIPQGGYLPICLPVHPGVYHPMYTLPIPPWVYHTLYIPGLMYVSATLVGT